MESLRIKINKYFPHIFLGAGGGFILFLLLLFVFLKSGISYFVILTCFSFLIFYLDFIMKG